MGIKVVSLSGSLEGWSFLTWWDKNKLWILKLFKSNKETIKGIISILGGIIVAFFPENPAIKALFAVGSGYVIKLICDSIDFFASNVVLE